MRAADQSVAILEGTEAVSAQYANPYRLLVISTWAAYAAVPSTLSWGNDCASYFCAGVVRNEPAHLLGGHFTRQHPRNRQRFRQVARHVHLCARPPCVRAWLSPLAQIVCGTLDGLGPQACRSSKRQAVRQSV